MAMGVIWTALVLSALVCGAVNGRLDAVTAAALEGAGAAVELVLTMAGALCLWCGVMELLRRGGLAGALARRLRPLLGRLLPGAARDRETMEAVSANVSANLLGLGNAATPLGLAAMQELQKLNRQKDTASNAMVTFVVLNTASLQLIPTTCAVLRQQAGSAAPMEILPAVWLSSVASAAAALTLARLLRGGKR